MQASGIGYCAAWVVVGRNMVKGMITSSFEPSGWLGMRYADLHTGKVIECKQFHIENPVLSHLSLYLSLFLFVSFASQLCVQSLYIHIHGHEC